MPDFQLLDIGYSPFPPSNNWRPLRKKAVQQQGWDVYDLQCKLNYLSMGVVLVKDGVFGPATDKVVRDFQTRGGLTSDGIAGSVTQTTLGAEVCGKAPLPNRVLGQMTRESSLLCGIYTPRYTNGSFDTGPLERNTRYHPNLNENFNVGKSIPVLVQRIEDYFEKYQRWGVSEVRSWEAAQGSWNSPVYADRYAEGKTVPQEFLDYIEAVTVYA